MEMTVNCGKNGTVWCALEGKELPFKELPCADGTLCSYLSGTYGGRGISCTGDLDKKPELELRKARSYSEIIADRTYDAKRGNERKRATASDPAHDNPNLVPVRKWVKKRWGTYQQTFWVRREEAEQMEAGEAGKKPDMAGNAHPDRPERYSSDKRIYGGYWGEDAFAEQFLLRLVRACKRDCPDKWGFIQSLKHDAVGVRTASEKERKLVSRIISSKWEGSAPKRVIGVYSLGNEGDGEPVFWGGDSGDILCGMGFHQPNTWFVTGEPNRAYGMCAVSDGWEHGDVFQAGFASIRVVLMMSLPERGKRWTADDWKRREGEVPGDLSGLFEHNEFVSSDCVPLFAIEFE